MTALSKDEIFEILKQNQITSLDDLVSQIEAKGAEDPMAPSIDPVASSWFI